MQLTTLLAWFLPLLVGADAANLAPEPVKDPMPVISALGGGSSGRAVWRIDIDATGRLEAKVAGGSQPKQPVRVLTETEQSRLRLLIAALPVDGQHYSFGYWVIDASMFFTLRVGGGKTARTYEVTEGLSEEDAVRPEVRAIVDVLNFLHGFVGSKSATPPPQLKGAGVPK